ncbi:MAG: phosphoenolpyruvate synthase, partial [Candidatus Aenigmatarchaeota archaeon]
MSDKNVVWFKELGADDVDLAGGKNASLGEMINQVNVPVPPGFALTSEGYDLFVEEAGIRDDIRRILEGADLDDVNELREGGKKVRELIKSCEIPQQLKYELKKKYRKLSDKLDTEDVLVAVRSSATAEDLPDASFAGQQETYLNVSGVEELLEATKNCIASLFTDRAISYREDKGFDHFKVKLSVGIQEMVHSLSSGVMFSIDPDSGFEDVVYINGSWGLGEMVVGGEVNPDEFVVFKPTGKLISKDLGEKKEMMVREDGENIRKEIPEKKKNSYVISDEEAEKLGEYAKSIAEYYDRPMDIEWAKDERNDKLYILQARPETVHSQKDKNVIETYRLKEESGVLCEGQAIGRMIGSGEVNVIMDADEIDQFEEGQVLVTDMTDPDWEPIMKIASAIVTEKGGSTSHAAIVSRELGIPAVVGTEDASSKLKTGQKVTVDCTTGDGRIMEGELDFEVDEKNIEEVPETDTQVMMNVGVPSNAFDHGQYPVKGVGLARQEFVVGSWIGEHPLHMKEQGREEEFINKLSYGLAQIAAGFYPKPVIVRLSDFKSNEYANMKGGEKYEPEEENPMIGWRGASRYTSENFRPAFDMECKALKKVRDEMGLTNVKIMVPFCRTLEEAKEVKEVLAENGLEGGKNDLDIYVMTEIPSNVILAEEFAKEFDGFSVGSNDLTQLTLGVDRDNQRLQETFDERNEAVKRSIRTLIKRAHKHNTKVGICGDAPSSHPEYAAFLVDAGIDSISVTPDMA